MTESTKNQLMSLLTQHFTRGCGDWRAYERAKGYLDDMGLSSVDRAEAITIIVNFLGV